MFYNLTTSEWKTSFSSLEKEDALHALERGNIIYLPQLSFELSAEEQELLTPEVLQANIKNISFDPANGKLKGNRKEEKAKSLTALLARFAKNSRVLINNLLPTYETFLIEGRTSYRPIEIVGRKTSALKDDTRLHVDAFPATPNQGKRILRVFTNINPFGKSRLWHVGEAFSVVVERFLPQLKKPFVGTRSILVMLGITKSYRTLYDHYMLILHNQMKLNNDYQKNVQKIVQHFPPSSSWIVMTDSVSHAALSGQFALEQTFYLPPQYMANPALAPLSILEKALGRKLSL